MKLHSLVVLASLLMVSTNALAEVSAFFQGKDGAVTMIAQGTAGNKDAPALFDLLNRTPTEENGLLKKEISFTDSDGATALQITCKVSKTIKDFGSCTLVINSSKWANIKSVVRYADYGVFDKIEAGRLAQLFVLPQGASDFYSSGDGRLKIHYSNSDIGDFGIVYSEH